jgi:hypothetical protein
MIGKILFLSAAAYAGYRYIRRSNRKAQEIAQAEDIVHILPPETPVDSSAKLLPAAGSSAAVETSRPRRSPVIRSRAAEGEPSR